MTFAGREVRSDFYGSIYFKSNCFPFKRKDKKNLCKMFEFLKIGKGKFRPTTGHERPEEE
jgi:hypothetical protein